MRAIRDASRWQRNAMIHTRKEIRLVGAKREKGYRYRNPDRNLRHVRLAKNCPSAKVSTRLFSTVLSH